MRRGAPVEIEHGVASHRRVCCSSPCGTVVAGGASILAMIDDPAYRRERASTGPVAGGPRPRSGCCSFSPSWSCVTSTRPGSRPPQDPSSATRSPPPPILLAGRRSSSPSPARTPPRANAMLSLAYLGAMLLTAGLITLGVGLRSPAPIHHHGTMASGRGGKPRQRRRRPTRIRVFMPPTMLRNGTPRWRKWAHEAVDGHSAASPSMRMAEPVRRVPVAVEPGPRRPGRGRRKSRPPNGRSGLEAVPRPGSVIPVPRVRGIRFDLASEVDQVDAQGVALVAVVRSPHLTEQPPAHHQLPGVAD